MKQNTDSSSFSLLPDAGAYDLKGAGFAGG